MPLILTSRAFARLRCLVLAMALGCGDDESVSLGNDAGALHAMNEGDADLPASACEQAADGAACGNGRHCERSACLPDTCGDGYVQANEQCDDGNEAIEDACDPACRIIPRGCGDGIVQDDEECDDGNRYDVDACSVACTRNECGNERVDGLEECDDGNLVNDDGCSNRCTENRCRNGRLDPGEECDDGNRNNDDLCNNACKVQICGDTVVEVKEECDDGNLVDDDACSNACTANLCGNHRIDPGELCDGDTVAYACADDCKTLADDTCRPCEEEHCSAYMSELDLVAGCFHGSPREDLVPIVDTKFAQNCIDVVDCARRSGCGFSPGNYGVDCFCGSRNVDDCIAMGPGSDAPCIAQWQAATRQTSPSLVLSTLGDLSAPSGWATYTLECDATECKSECVPKP